MSAITFGASSGVARGTAMSNGRMLRAYLTEARYETIRMLRTPAFAFPFLILPVALYLLFAVVLFADGLRADPKAAMGLFLGLCVFGMMGPGMFGFGAGLAVERDQGLLKLKRALPMPPAAYLMAKMFMAALFNALVMATMIPTALTVGHLKLTGGQILSLAAIDVLAALPFCAIGLCVGVLSKGTSGAAFTNLVYLPMMYLSGLFFPLSKFMQKMAMVWPAYHVNQLGYSVAGLPSQGDPLTHVAVLAGVTLLLTAFAGWPRADA